MLEPESVLWQEGRALIEALESVARTLSEPSQSARMWVLIADVRRRVLSDEPGALGAESEVRETDVSTVRQNFEFGAHDLTLAPIGETLADFGCRCFDKQAHAAARFFLDYALILQPDFAPARRALTNLMRRDGALVELRVRLEKLAARARTMPSRREALRDAARIAANVEADPRAATLIYKKCLEGGSPIDVPVLKEAIVGAVDAGIVDGVPKILNWLPARQRAALIERLYDGAMMAGQVELAERLLASAFYDSPHRSDAYRMMRRALHGQDPAARATCVARRLSAGIADDERHALTSELVEIMADGEEIDAALEAAVMSVCVALDPDSLEGSLDAVDRLSQIGHRRAFMAQALEQASELSWLKKADRLAYLRELAEEYDEVGDSEGEASAIARAEALEAAEEHPRFSDVPARDTSKLVERMAEPIARLIEREAGRAGAAQERKPRSGSQDIEGLEDERSVRLHVEAGDVQSLCEWLEGHAELDQVSTVTLLRAGALLEAWGKADDAERVFRAALRHDPSADTSSVPASKLLKRLQAELTLLKDRNRKRSGASPDDLAVHRDLLESALQTGAAEMIEEALIGIRACAELSGDRRLAFFASGALLARGAARSGDRITHANARGSLRFRPSQSIGSVEWLAIGGLPPLDEVADGAIVQQAPVQRFVPSRVLTETWEHLTFIFGAPRAELVPTSSSEVAREIDPHSGISVRVGIPNLVAQAPRIRSFRFTLGRVAAALSDPTLWGALTLESRGEQIDDAHQGTLDRAGLLAALDPVTVLETVGPDGPRGRALLPYMLSAPFLDLIARLDIGPS